MTQSIHTIVVGSGISGMAAASELALSGYQVLVLEGNNYIGGRTKTIPVKLANQAIFKFDQGANWIHGSCQEHPITQLSQEMGNVQLVLTDDDESIVSYDKGGSIIDDQVDREYERYEKLLEQSEEFDGGSVFQAFQNLNAKKLSNKCFMHHVSNDIEFETSAPIQDLSAKHGQQDGQFEGDQMFVMSGYQAFPEYLSVNENIKVLTNHQVTQVNFNGTKNIVKCSNGLTFQAPNIIISVPIGVLKNKSIRFHPQLPPWKQQAIQKIHFGNVCKILIILKDKLINKKQHYIAVVEDNIQKRGSATYFLNLSGLAGLPALMTFGLGANADELEFMPENQLKELIASRLSVFSGKKFSTNDFEIKRTSWRGNPNFKGTYSYSGVQTEPVHWENMARPIFETNTHFCGEHTHFTYRGTVHGAFLSGIDAASCILQQLNDESWWYPAAQGGNFEYGQGVEQFQGEGQEFEEYDQEEEIQGQEEEQMYGQEEQINGQDEQVNGQGEGGKIQGRRIKLQKIQRIKRVQGKKVQGKKVQGKKVEGGKAQGKKNRVEKHKEKKIEGGKAQEKKVEGKKVHGKRQRKTVAVKSKGKDLKSGPNQVKSSGTQPCCQIA